MELFVFIVAGIGALAGALTLILAKNPVYAALGMLGTLFSLADFVQKHPRLGIPSADTGAGGWAGWLLGNIGWLFGLLGLGILVLLAVLYRREIVPALRQLFVRADRAGRSSDPDKDDGPA